MMYLRPLGISKEYKKLRYRLLNDIFNVLQLEICLIIYQISTLISKHKNSYELYLTIIWENNKRENKMLVGRYKNLSFKYINCNNIVVKIPCHSI